MNKKEKAYALSQIPAIVNAGITEGDINTWMFTNEIHGFYKGILLNHHTSSVRVRKIRMVISRIKRRRDEGKSLDKKNAKKPQSSTLKMALSRQHLPSQMKLAI